MRVVVGLLAHHGHVQPAIVFERAAERRRRHFIGRLKQGRAVGFGPVKVRRHLAAVAEHFAVKRTVAPIHDADHRPLSFAEVQLFADLRCCVTLRQILAHRDLALSRTEPAPL